MRRVCLALACVLGASACATTGGPMQRGLDASMERVLRTESYLRTVTGISANPARLSRGDGYIYLSDVAPQLRYMANTGDTARYRALRAYTVEHLMPLDETGRRPARRYRSDGKFEPATLYGYVWLTKSLRDGWQLLGDTASAEALARIKVDVPALPKDATRMYVVTAACGDAMDVIDTDQRPARAVLADARKLLGSKRADAEQRAAGISVVEGEVDLLSCLTRVGLALKDPDITVRYLDHMLDHLEPLLSHSGRPDLGTSSDVLLTLQWVRRAGPAFYDAGYYTKQRTSSR